MVYILYSDFRRGVVFLESFCKIPVCSKLTRTYLGIWDLRPGQDRRAPNIFKFHIYLEDIEIRKRSRIELKKANDLYDLDIDLVTLMSLGQADHVNIYL